MPEKEDILEDIKKVAKDYEYLSMVEYSEDGNYTVRDVKNNFGRWSDAKKEAGLEVRNLNISREEILEDLKRVSEEVEYVSTYNYPDLGKYSVNTIRRKFDNWSTAKEKAGLEVRTKPLGVTKEDLKEDIQKVFDEMDGDRITIDEYKEKGQYSVGPISKHGWNNLLEELDIKTYHNNTKIKKEDLLERMKKELDTVGVGNMKYSFEETNIPRQTVRTKFGSIEKGLKEAGVWITKEESLEMIKDAVKEMNSGYHKSTEFKDKIKEKTSFHIGSQGITMEDIIDYCNENGIEVSRNSSKMSVYVENEGRYDDEDSYEQYLYEKFRSFNQTFDLTCERFDLFKKYIGKGYSPSGVYAALVYIESGLKDRPQIPQAKISSEVNVSEVTLRKIYQKIKEEEELKVEKTK